MVPTTYGAPVGFTGRNVYTTKIRSIDDVNEIFCVIAVIPADMLHRVFANFEHRVQ